ncbi:hypothetical protein [Bordetella sp. LUAb4]|uniref:hypothetical protein n=1 Tax=Bordetella sp. LUAb4 TaxID=2843195 RepID=UPI001E2F2D2D|nr:hypothetical protein [Bordetella sp. LUAb4]
MRNAAAEMTGLFNTNLPVCTYDNSFNFDYNRPAFLCSGIIIRTAASGPGFNSWDVPPKSLSGIDAGAVSFSWIRMDSTFTDLGDSGFTLLPALGQYSDSTKMKMTVLCAFPLDGWTYDRNNKGCGYAPPYTSGDVCQKHGVTTGAAWAAQYLNPGNVPMQYNQCGFDVSSSPNEPGRITNGDAFYSIVSGRISMSNVNFTQRANAFKLRNEIRIQNWDNSAGTEARLPIQSFYYLGSSPNAALARQAAMADQRSYFQKYGVRVPVVMIISPTRNWMDDSDINDPWAKFTFYQNSADQGV